MLTISLASVLILNDGSLTPWTNQSLCGVPGVTYYNKNPANKLAILSNASVLLFAQTINNMSASFNFKFDYAVGVMKYSLILNQNLLF